MFQKNRFISIDSTVYEHNNYAFLPLGKQLRRYGSKLSFNKTITIAEVTIYLQHIGPIMLSWLSVIR